MKIAQMLTTHLRDRHVLGPRYLRTELGGFPLMVHPKDHHFWGQTKRGNWEPETIDFMRKHIRPGTRYLDVGAFVGPTVLLANKLGAKVTCFEPDHAALERLLFNIRMNTDGKDIDIFPVALGDRDGIISIASMSEFLGQACTSIHQGHPSSPIVRSLMISWDSAVKFLNEPVFDVVKIDIEGGESCLLPAMLPYLEKTKPFLHLSTHFCFIPEPEREGLRIVLRKLWSIYGKDEAFEPEVFEQGTPNFFLADPSRF